jgi:hypothetical protein
MCSSAWRAAAKSAASCTAFMEEADPSVPTTIVFISVSLCLGELVLDGLIVLRPGRANEGRGPGGGGHLYSAVLSEWAAAALNERQVLVDRTA